MSTPSFPLIRRGSLYMQLLPKMTEGEIKVYLVLAMHASKGKGVAYPKRETIKDSTGLNIRTITEATKGLERLGLITKKRRKRTVEYCLDVQESCNSKQGQEVQDNYTSEKSRSAGQQHEDVQDFSPRSAVEQHDTSINTPLNTPFKHQGAHPADASRFSNEHDRAAIQQQHPDLWQAVATCYDAEAFEQNRQTQATACGIVDQIAKHGATPEQVAERWAWLQRNDPAASRTWIGRHWEQVGLHLALGSEPGKRPNAKGWALPKAPDDPLFDAIARCHSTQYERYGKATGPQLEEIAEAQQALAGKGATPDEVTARYRWMKRNDKRLGLRALVQFWAFAGECLEQGTEPGSRRSAHAEGAWHSTEQREAVTA